MPDLSRKPIKNGQHDTVVIPLVTPSMAPYGSKFGEKEGMKFLDTPCKKPSSNRELVRRGIYGGLASTSLSCFYLTNITFSLF